MSEIAETLKLMREQIDALCDRCPNLDKTVRSLIAVSKQQPEEKIQAALDAGQRVFGENKVQEAYAHWQGKRKMYPDLELHLIGPLQTNKAKLACLLFDVIHTLDREKLAKALVKLRDQGIALPRLFIQVNTGEEEQKAGILPQDLPLFLEFCQKDCGFKIEGLMCIPPQEEPAGLHFTFLKTLADRYGLDELSMGMSEDYDKAIVCGATHIRVGSALFGGRV